MTESKTLFRIALLACTVYTAGFASIAYEHVRYPGFTEAMEGDVLQHVERAAHGKPIYVSATAEYIPLAYFPGYYYFSAPIYWLFGDDLGGPRLVSCLASFIAAAAVGWVVKQESGSASAALFAVALFFAGYRIKDENLTTALPDAALNMWLMLAWSMIVGTRTWKRDLAAVLFFLAAFWTKQQGTLLASWGVLYVILVDRRGRLGEERDVRVAAPMFLLYALTTGLFISGFHPFGDRAFHYTIGVPSGWEHAYFSSIQRFILVTFLFVPFAWLAAGCYAFREGFNLRAFRRPLPFAIATTAVTCLYTVSASGSSNNHYIPLFTFLEATAVLGIWKILKDGPPRLLPSAMIVAAVCGCIVAAGAAWKNEGHSLPLFVAPLLVVAAVVGWALIRRFNSPQWWGWVLLVGQFAASFYLPWNYWPPSSWRTALAEFQSEMLDLDYDVAWPDYGAIPAAFAGGSIHRFPSWVVLEDVTRGRHPDPLDIEPFRERLMKNPPKWLITASPLETIPVWMDSAKDYVLETDYSTRFADLPQLDRHWFGDKIFPRFLYRRAANR